MTHWSEEGPVSVKQLMAMALGTRMRVAERTTRLLGAMSEVQDGRGVDAMLVTDIRNIRYLTGFTGGSACLAVTPRRLTLVTDARYADRAQAVLTAAEVPARIEITRDRQREAVVAAVGNARRVALEADTITWSTQRLYANEWLPGRELVPTAGLVERLRFVKDEGELARMRAAAAMADRVLTDLKSTLDEGPTEQDFRDLLDDQMRLLGSEEPAFPTIVASGPNAALPRPRASHRVIAEGDLVVIDFGGTVDGYRSDLSRTFMVGDVPRDVRALYDLVLEAQSAAVEGVHDGAAAADVDGACRSIAEAAGRGGQFTHSTGHGVGLVIHEHPLLSRTSADILSTGEVLTVEPGVYVPGIGGVRIEDLVTVTARGCELLTHTTKTPAPADDGATMTH